LHLVDGHLCGLTAHTRRTMAVYELNKTASLFGNDDDDDDDDGKAEKVQQEEEQQEEPPARLGASLGRVRKGLLEPAGAVRVAVVLADAVAVSPPPERVAVLVRRFSAPSAARKPHHACRNLHHHQKSEAMTD